MLLYVYWNIEIIEKKKESEQAERFDKHIDLRVLMHKRDFNRVIPIFHSILRESWALEQEELHSDVFFSISFSPVCVCLRAASTAVP